MKNLSKLTLGLVLCLAPLASWSYENFAVETAMQDCYSLAMIGMDSVINSRVGVPAEHALPLSRKLDALDTDYAYDDRFLVVMLDAYLWDKTPHSYALKVFYDCAVNNRPLHSAKLSP